MKDEDIKYVRKIIYDGYKLVTEPNQPDCDVVKDIDYTSGATISSLKKLIERFPDDLPIDLFIHAPNFRDIEIDVKIRTFGKTTESDFKLKMNEIEKLE